MRPEALVVVAVDVLRRNSSPSCVSTALSVGATYDANVGAKNWSFFNPTCYDAATSADKVACFSQTGRYLDMLAPGTEIYGAGGAWTGTSQAAPHVAGAAAVLAAAKPSATVNAIESAFLNTGPRISDSRYATTITRPRLDVYAALSTLLSSGSGDTTPPVMSAVTQQFPVGQQISSTQAPVQYSWSATDAGGVSAYEVYWSIDNGATWTKDTSAPVNATSIVRWLTFGTTYTYAVRAGDAAGNWSAYSYSVPVKPGITDDKGFSVSGWTRYNLAGTYGGTYTASKQAGAWLQHTFTGRDIALIGPKFSNSGRATLYCDGTAFGLIDEYSSATVTGQVVAWCHFAQSGQHTMKIVVEGTSGRPWFGVDAFAVLS